MSSGIEIRGLEQTLREIKSAADLDFLDDTLMEAGVYLKGKVAVYPPSKSGPGRYSLKTHRPMGWYKRGTGWMSPIVRKGRAIRYVNYEATSETLGRKWTITRRGRGAVVIGNNVTYGPFVQSRVRVGGAGPQSRLMKAYGWQTVEDVIEAEERTVVDKVLARIQKRFGGK